MEQKQPLKNGLIGPKNKNDQPISGRYITSLEHGSCGGLSS